MKSMRRGVAVLLAALLMMPTMPARAAGEVVLPVAEAGEDADFPGTTGNMGADISVPQNPEDGGDAGSGLDVIGSGDAADADDGAEDSGEMSIEAGDRHSGEGMQDSGESVDDTSQNPEKESSAGAEDGAVSDAGQEAGAGDGAASDAGQEAGAGDGAASNAEQEAGPEGSATDDVEMGGGTESEAGAGADAEDDADQSAGTEGSIGEDVGEDEDDAGREPGDDEASVQESKEEDAPSEEGQTEFGKDAVFFSTGYDYNLVINEGASEEYDGFTGTFEEDGSYTIQIPEEDPFFPYEVQFVDQEFETAENLWFMTPDSVVEYGGHTFRVEASFTGKAVTQLSLNIAGDTVVIYPGEKSFGGTEPISLLPLKEVYLRDINVTGYTPLELTMVSIQSIFAGKVEMTDKDRIMWTKSYSGTDYTINQVNGYVDLSYADQFQMIVGEPDQLAADNVRYLVDINKSDDEGWLTPVFYGQGEDGTRTEVKVKREYYYSYDGYGSASFQLSSLQGSYQEGYLGLRINTENYRNTKFTSVRAFSGRHQSVGDAMAAQEVTGQIFCGDMSAKNAGYPVEQNDKYDITLVSFDAAGNVTGCLPMSFRYYNAYNSLSTYSLCDGKGNTVANTSWSKYEDGCVYYTSELYSDYPTNGTYYQRLGYSVDGEEDNTKVTAAYRGRYSSIAEAVEAGAVDIRGELFGSRGYAGDYSQGIYFTIFIGEDGAEGRTVYQYNFKTEERAENSQFYVDALNSGTAVRFHSLMDGEGKYVSSFALQDSYAESNYIVYLVDEGTDLSRLAPEFYLSYDNLKLYAEGSVEPEISGKSCHDFSRGPVQYTASSEDKTHAKNYWVQVISKGEAHGRVFMNSLADPNVETATKNGVIYTTREMMLDTLHGYKHDIMLANVGAQAIQGLSAELASDTLELDDYWTLKGNHELSGFTTTERTTSFGELSNLAMLRLRKKEGVADGTDVSGTLTIKSGSTVLMVMKLTGTVGDPVITTKEVPVAVKYVPYGTMIQSSNKYSWNEVSFELWSGELPGGMVIKPNGELYGVPTQAGEFTFTVWMRNSFSRFGEQRQEFTLVVKENTDANVDNATDENYNLTERVAYQYNTSMGNQRMVSQGVFEEFVDLWLDGVRLEKGVDYDAESGSTRITVYGQTLGGNGTGTHTLGIEFRTSDTDSVKTAAQNYVVGDGNSSGGNTSGGNRPGGNTPGGGSSSGATGGGENGSGDIVFDVVPGTGAVAYTVEEGDTLWSIAVKFFGDGNQWKKIYEDNKDILSDPNMIYAGQVLVINVAWLTTGQETIQGGIYTVQPGDSLWRIAEKAYGNGRRWRRIYEANTDKISDASKIYVGQTLVIPE
ncbi:LysM peptidoglycan-binding domain-containing protein [uncultured Acetatifactor sp.]|uniref:LysM peptidoglycan-binding domain-containing protein n=1 Tax=uncultured Acetatifactor sp. TaxID=1671927 RepID=UPI00260E8DB7|nr:LysM peptidoglycan-binding domain-containing protein [uncultured Acetatifactor sp.]